MKHQLIFLSLIITTLLMTAGCARMGQPDGGWYDETPPKVVSCRPADKSTNVNSKKIIIEFDEYIKLDNPSEKVVISPPQQEVPDIKGAGRTITVTLVDSLIPNTTYTVDFSDAISDNNENNPLGNYTYCFSTGDHIDTLEVSGYVVDAENMEPIKGIFVGLYNNLNDTAFTTTPMLRYSSTDEEGHFVVKGVAPGDYRAFALKDLDGNYFFSQKGEQIAFNHDIITPSCKPDFRQDTIWRDTLHIDNITKTGYTHFLPDDIVLKAFTEKQTDRYLIKKDRTDAECLAFYFSYGNPQLPDIKGLNFDEKDAFILQASEKRDTLKYWLRDTTLVKQDTLNLLFTYLKTDSTGVLQSQTDTLEMLAKTSYEKRMKEKAKELEKWTKEQEKARKKGKPFLTEMPVKPLDLNINVQSEMMPDGYISIISPTPLQTVDTTKIHLKVKVDTLWHDVRYILKEQFVDVEEQMSSARMKYILQPDSTDFLWTPGKQYSLQTDSAAFVDIYGKASKDIKKGMKIRSLKSMTSVSIHVAMLEESAAYVGQLLEQGEKINKQVSSTNGNLKFEYIKPGIYFIRIFVDNNGNGVWDTGNYAADQQAEAVYYYPEKIECKEHWPIELNWNPIIIPYNKLKPSALKKTKTEKKKKIKNLNAERALKLGITYIPKNNQ